MNEIINVLLIDNDKFIHRLIKKYFSKEQNQMELNIHSAVNLDEFNDKIELDLNIILLDWNMENIDGLEIFEMVKKIKGDNFPVIMITGNESLTLALEFMKNGGYNFMVKPLNMELLKINISDAMYNSRKKIKTLENTKKEHFKLGTNQEKKMLIDELSDVIYNDIHVLSNCIKILEKESTINASVFNVVNKKITSLKNVFSEIFND